MTIARLASMALAAGLGWATPSLAQPATLDAEAVVDFFIDLAGDEAALRATMEGYYGAVPDDVWAAMVKHTVPLLADPAYGRYIFANMADALTADTSTDALIELAGMVQQDAAVRGVLRLSQKKQEHFIAVAEDLLAWMGANDPESCREMMMGVPDLAAAARLEFQFHVDNEPAYVDRYYALTGEALRAEIHDDPRPRGMGSGPIATAAMAAYEGAVADAMAALPADTMLAAALGSDPDDPRLFCNLGAVTFSALWTLTPMERGYAILGFLGQMTGQGVR
ncbi:MAG: hypothetical protein AB7O56_13725 [Bauldia sp.]